ncbi:MAG: diguanylate cyclase domain-containing protein, partial [Acidimicrobiales bacterium]
RDPEFLTQRVSELDEAGLETSSDLLEFLDGRTLEARSQLQRVDGVIVGRVWSFRDITERKLLESRLSHQAFHDSLTGLGNRGLFMDRLQHALERRERGTGRVAVLFLDVDEFKSVNDNFGHAVGDALLQTIARRIGTCIRSGDTAARMGGDEFGIIFEDLNGPDEALALTQRIVAEVRLPCVLLGKDIAVSVSAGIAFDEPGLSCDALLGRADLAMYAAKTHGGDAYAPFVDDMLASPSQPSRG